MSRESLPALVHSSLRFAWGDATLNVRQCCRSRWLAGNWSMRIAGKEASVIAITLGDDNNQPQNLFGGKHFDGAAATG